MEKTPEQIYDAIRHWIRSSINKEQLAICKDVAEDHFFFRSKNPELLDSLLQLIDAKTTLNFS